MRPEDEEEARQERDNLMISLHQINEERSSVETQGSKGRPRYISVDVNKQPQLAQIQRNSHLTGSSLVPRAKAHDIDVSTSQKSGVSSNISSKPPSAVLKGDQKRGDKNLKRASLFARVGQTPKNNQKIQPINIVDNSPQGRDLDFGSSKKERSPVVSKAVNAMSAIEKLLEGKKGENSAKILKELKETLGSVDKENADAEFWMEKQEDKLVQIMNMYKIEKRKLEDVISLNTELEKQLTQDGILIGELKDLLEMNKNKDLSGAGDKLESLLKSINKRKADIAVLEELKPRVANIMNAQYSNSNLSLVGLDSPQKKNTDELASPTFRFPTSHSAVLCKSNFGKDVTLSLGQKTFLSERFNNVGLNTVIKIRKNLQEGKIPLRSYITLKAVLKQLKTFYFEKILQGKDNPMMKEQDLSAFVHKQFMNTYGYLRFGMEKFAKFIVSVKHHIYIHRVYVFARMINILEPEKNYTQQETKQYLNGLEFLFSHPLQGIYNSDYSQCHYIPLAKALEYVKAFGEKYEDKPQEDLLEYKKELEEMKANGINTNSSVVMIDVDVFLESMVEQYKRMRNKMKEKLMVAYLVTDFLKEERVRFAGLLGLCKEIEGDKLEEKRIEELFVSYCDMVGEDCLAMSKEQFFALCFDWSLFGEKKMNSYFGVINEEEFEKKAKSFTEKWGENFKETTALIEKKQGSVPGEVYARWKKILGGIHSDIFMDGIVEKKALLIRYQILYNDITNDTNKI